ncbi:RNA polymerase sigma factor [Streptomyces sp. NPDC048251]|uniref:RNA polymerase sigma factor n=1 Tax=Streptomyces sp. NPDC048251 TaxID=3154501 RepID=UPI00341B0A62
MAEREAVTAEALGDLYTTSRAGLTATARQALLARGVPDSVVSAEDIVQNAFTKALRDPASIQHPISYLRAVIRTEVANRARQQADRSRLEARRAADPLRFDPVHAPDFAALVANRCAVERALADLPLQQRTAVWATKALDCTQGEAAALMDRAPGTVATHVSRGMVLLRASLVAAAVAAVAALVGVAGRLADGPLQHTEPARKPGEGADTSPSRWWHEGRAVLAALYERRPEFAILSLLSLLALLAGCGLLWWARRRRTHSGRSGTFPGRWLSIRRTRRAWLSATSRLGTPFVARAITSDVIVFTAQGASDPDTVSKGMEQVSLHLERKLGRVVRLELSDEHPRRQHLTPNTRLHDLFRLAGWSKGELAGLVNRRAAAMGHPELATDTSRVRRWIEAGEIPRDPVPRVLAALFTERLGRVVTVEDLGLSRHGRTRRRPGGGSAAHPDDVPWAPERTAAVLTEFTGMDLMLNRRGSVGAGAALTARAATMHHRQPTERVGNLDTRTPHATREALKILEVVTHAPHGVLSRAQIARSLTTFGTAEAAALSMLIRQGYLQRLPDSRYTTGRNLDVPATDQATESPLLLPRPILP